MEADEGKTKIVRKKTRGRPSIYDPTNLAQVRKYALLGLTDEQIADLYNVSISTFRNWKIDISGFYNALQEGRDEADANVAATLYERACGYSHEAVKIFMPQGASEPVYAPYTEHYPPDVQAARIWLYNRRRDSKAGTKWSEVVQNQISGKDGGPIEMNVTEIRRVVVDPVVSADG